MGKKQNKPSSATKDKKDAPKKKESTQAKGEVWSKSKKKRMRRLMAKADTKDSGSQRQPQAKKQKAKGSSKGDNETEGSSKLSALQQSFMARLTGSRFRELNEVSLVECILQRLTEQILTRAFFPIVGPVYDDIPDCV